MTTRTRTKATPKRVRARPAAVQAAEPAPLTPTVQRDEGVLMVRRCAYSNSTLVPGSESMVEERVPTPRFVGEVARTRVSLGITKQLGGFEFARIDVMVEMPCNPNPDDLRETNEFASRTATEFMNRELASINLGISEAPEPVQQRTDMSALTHG